MVALVEGLEGLGGEVAGEEEECVYPLGSSVSREEFFVKIDVAFGMVDGPMPTPSWVPCGNVRFWGWVGCVGMLLGVGGGGGVVGVLLTVSTALVLCGVAVWVVG